MVRGKAMAGKRVPKEPAKQANVNKRTVSMLADTFNLVGPHAQDIANYLAHGTAIGGTAALGKIIRDVRRMKSKHDKELGRAKGGLMKKPTKRVK